MNWLELIVLTNISAYLFVQVFILLFVDSSVADDSEC